MLKLFSIRSNERETRILIFQIKKSGRVHSWQYFNTFEKICGDAFNDSDQTLKAPKEEIVFIETENHSDMMDEDPGDDSHSMFYEDEDYELPPPVTKKRKIDDDEDQEYQKTRLSIERQKLKELQKINQSMREHNKIMKELLQVVKQKLS